MSSPEACASSTPAEKRQPRQSRLVKAALACQRLGQFDVTIRNVSETGIGGQGPHILQIGERMTVLLSGLVAALVFGLLKAIGLLRVPEEHEREGLDITSHGESAYEA